MKSLLTIFSALLILELALISQNSITPIYATDYAQQSKAFIQRSTADINTFITIYKKNTTYISSSQSQQIESQYNGITHTLSEMSDNVSKDSGENLVTDYQSLQNLEIYETKLPMLYSELFTYKAAYILTRLNEYDLKDISSQINSVPKGNNPQALDDSSKISSLLAQSQLEEQKIISDYSTLSDQASLTNSTSAAKIISQTLNDIKTNQQLLLKNIQAINGLIQDIANLS